MAHIEEQQSLSLSVDEYDEFVVTELENEFIILSEI